MTVDLTDELEEAIKMRLARGGYATAADVIKAGLEALSEREQEGRILEQCERSWQRYAAGAPARTVDEVFADVDTRLKERIADAQGSR